MSSLEKRLQFKFYQCNYKENDCSGLEHVKRKDRTWIGLLKSALEIQPKQKLLLRCGTRWLTRFWNISRAVERAGRKSK
jgi:hypothetical protein